MTARETELQLYADTYSRYCEAIEKFMRDVYPHEITLLIGEDNSAIRAITKEATVYSAIRLGCRKLTRFSRTSRSKGYGKAFISRKSRNQKLFS
jgi:hypothetical protein